MPALTEFQILALYVLAGCAIVIGLVGLICTLFPIKTGKEPPRG